MMNKIGRPAKGQRGQVLVAVLILMLVSTLMITPLLRYMYSGRMATASNETKMDRLYTADAGVEYALQRIKDNSGLPNAGSTISGLSIPSNLNTNKTSVSIFCLQKMTSGGIYKVTSAAIGPDGSTTVIQSWTESYPSFWDNAVTTTTTGSVNLGSNDNVTGPVAGGITGGTGSTVVNGTSAPGPYPDNYAGYGSDQWPFSNNATFFEDYFWNNPVSLSPYQFTSDSSNRYLIDTSLHSTIGPGYFSENTTNKGQYFIYPTSQSSNMTYLTGTVYGQGADSQLNIGQTGHTMTLNLNYKTIYVEGSHEVNGNKYAIYIDPNTTITGSGIIMAEGDIYFKPNLACSPNDFIFVMSIDGSVTFQPSGTLYGSVAGYQGVTLGSNTDVIHTDPQVAKLNFPPLPGPTESAKVMTWNINTSNSVFITTTTLPNATPQVLYSANLSAVGGTKPYTWSASDLSGTWLSLDSSSGALSGIPTTSGTLTFKVTVTDSKGSKDTRTLSIVSGNSASSFKITGYPSSTIAGSPFGFTITAEDADGNVDTSYTGTVNFISSDPLFVPLSYKFESTDNGTKSFDNVALFTAGSQSIVATDAVDPNVTRSMTVNVDPAPIAHYQVSPISANQTVDLPFSVSIQAQDQYNNDITTGPESSETVSIVPGISDNGSTPNAVTTFDGAATTNVTMTTVCNGQTITFTGDSTGKSGTSNLFSVQASGIATLIPFADAYVDSAYPATNYGTDPSLWVSKSGSELKSSFIRFDLSALSGKIIKSATLRLYDISGSNVVQPYVVYKNWTETGVTWNTTDGSTSWYNLQNPGADYGNPSSQAIASGGAVYIDLTQDVQAFANGTPNYGWILISAGTGNPGVSFASREAGSDAPILTVTYQP